MGKNESDQFNCATLLSGSNHNKKGSVQNILMIALYLEVSVPQALKFNIENAKACITSQVYFREISLFSWNNMVDNGHGMQW